MTPDNRHFGLDHIGSTSGVGCPRRWSGQIIIMPAAGARHVNQLERLRLQRDHRHLEEEIQRIMGQPRTDPLLLQRLKKQKLAIKDRLYRIIPKQDEIEHAA